MDLIISTVWLVLFIYFRSVNYSLIYLCMQCRQLCTQVYKYLDVYHFVVVCMYMYVRMYVLYMQESFLETDRYAVSSVSLRTVKFIGQSTFSGRYPDLLLVWQCQYAGMAVVDIIVLIMLYYVCVYVCCKHVLRHVHAYWLYVCGCCVQSMYDFLYCICMLG